MNWRTARRIVCTCSIAASAVSVGLWTAQASARTPYRSQAAASPKFSAGLSRQTRSADDVALRNLLNGDVVHSRIDVRTTGFIYSLAYQF